MLRIGLAGSGAHGARYMKHLLAGDVPGVRLAALARRDRARGEAQAREAGVAFFPDVSALAAADEVDAVLLCTPADLHAEHLRAVLDVAKPVLVEKPAVASVAEGRAVLAVARAKGATVMTAQTLREEPVFRSGLDRARELGPVRVLQITVARALGGGAGDERLPHRALFGYGVHSLDWAGILVGHPFRRAFALEPEGPRGLAAVALLEAEGGACLSLAVRLASGAVRETFTIVAERGVLEGDRAAHRLGRVDEKGALAPIDVGPRIATLVPILARFRDVCAGAPNPIPLEDGVRAVARAEACFRSLASGRAEVVEENL